MNLLHFALFPFLLSNHLIFPVPTEGYYLTKFAEEFPPDLTTEPLHVANVLLLEVNGIDILYWIRIP